LPLSITLIRNCHTGLGWFWIRYGLKATFLFFSSGGCRTGVGSK
jgi:hypothetical protein